MNRKKRVVVTGMGVVSSIGIGLNAFWRNLLAGKSGISRVRSFNAANFRTQYASEVRNFRPGRFMKTPANKGRATQFLLAALKPAVKDAKLNVSRPEPSDTGIIVGTSALEPKVIEDLNQIRITKGFHKVPPEMITKAAVDIPAVVAARELNIKGFVSSVHTACSAGNYAIGYGYDLIRQGRAKMVFCCGVDVFLRSIFAGFNRLFIIAPEKCQPFDKNRKGTIMGEGAAVLVLEALDDAVKRNADIYAEVLGYGLSCDAYSMTIPAKEGMKKVIKRTLKNSGVRKEEIDYISAHGTGTLNNDRNEAAAISEIFGTRTKNIPVSSIKSMIGHAVSAASGLEAVSCCLSLRDNIMPPTINFQTPDPECNVNVVANKPRKKKLNIIMNNAFAFGGNNACVIFKKFKKQR
jgi:3-oxoacyl-[acyl-carrier-protein] synthase II